MKKSILLASAALMLVLVAGACKGRTQENMVPDSDTVEVEISGGVVDMPEPGNDSVIADSPAEAAADSAQTLQTN